MFSVRAHAACDTLTTDSVHPASVTLRPAPKARYLLPNGQCARIKNPTRPRRVVLLLGCFSHRTRMVVASSVKSMRRCVASATSSGQRQALSPPQSSCGEQCPGLCLVNQGHVTGHQATRRHRAS